MSMLGAMAGLGKGLSMVGEQNLQAIQRQDEAAASEDRQRRIEGWRAKMGREYRLTEMQDALALDAQKRGNRQDTINSQMGRNADAALADRYADPVQGDEPLTPEQQASQDQGLKQQAVDKERDRLRMMRDPRNMVRAAVETGYEDPKVLLQDDTRQQLAALKFEVDNAKTESARQIALAKMEAAQSALDAKLSKADINKPPAGYRQTPEGNLQAIPGGPADTKLQGALNADTASLNASTDGLNRLATTANQLMNHPGLSGITGLSGKLPSLPGGNAADANAILETLKSQVGFGVLQAMRDASKTGGALGNVSDAEGKRLEANLAALNQAQSLDQFKRSLGQILDFTDGAKGRLREAYNLRHGDKQPAPTTSASAPRINSPAELESLPSGTTFTAPDGSIRRKP